MNHRAALLAQASALEAQATALRTLAETLPDAETDDLLDVDQALERYGIGRDGLLAAERRGDVSLSRGPRNKILVARSELENLQRRPHVATKARQRKPVDSLEAYDRETEHELRVLAGGRR